MEKQYTESFPSAIGEIRIQATTRGVSMVEILPYVPGQALVEYGGDPRHDSMDVETSVDAEHGQAKLHAENAKSALSDYLSRGSEIPTVALDLVGTQFQVSVWREISQLKLGETTTYGEIAARIGRPKAVRAVGAAVGSNPVPLLIGCHRVLGSTGRLTGYSGGAGLATKRELLRLEGIEFRE